MLDLQLCRKRQRRLLDKMNDAKLDVAVIGLREHVYYFTNHRAFWLHEAAFVVRRDGATKLVCGNSPDPATVAVEAKNVATYESNWLGTQRQDQAAGAASKIGDGGADDIIRSTDRVGVDGSAVSSYVARRHPHVEAFDEAVWELRRSKESDEIALMRHAIAGTEAMYRRAREIIEPGVSELHVFTELQKAAVETAGEPLWPAYLGNDYACAVPGGQPRSDHTANAGELYILDLGPAYRGYFSDNARTISVDRKPSDEQFKAWQIVTGVFPIIERLAKPGVRCRDLFDAIDKHYRNHTGKPFPHHLGHGVGLQPHEFPHLNPKWDDVLIENEVFTAEPGLYALNLRAGMRIENQYLVTKNGVENLTPFPMQLA